MDDMKLGFVAGLWVAVVIGFVGWFAYGSILNFVSTVISVALVFTAFYIGPPALTKTASVLRNL